MRCLLDLLFVLEEQIIFPFVAATARHSLLPFAEGAVGCPAVQFFSGGGVGLPTSKFCLSAVHERGPKKRFDEPSVVHMLFICVGGGAGHGLPGVGRPRRDCNLRL